MVNKCDFFKISELAGCCPEDPCENHGAVHMLSKKGGLAVPQESLEVAEREGALYFAFSSSVLVPGLWLPFVTPCPGEGEGGEPGRRINDGLKRGWST